MRTSHASVLSVLLVLLTFGSMAGARERSRGPSHHSPQVSRGSDQVSAAAAPSRFSPAPVPNRDVVAPTQPENPRTHLAPSVFRLSNQYPGDGYVYGSSPQGMDDRKAALIPGLKLVTPLPYGQQR